LGTVLQTFGRSYVNLLDFCMTDKPYKTAKDNSNNFNITGISPFSICGKPDGELLKYASCERTNMRVKTDIMKNFEELIQKAYADYFVLDNTCALIGLWKINGQLYSLMGSEKTDFIDDFFNNNPEIKNNYIKPVIIGFSEELRKQYDLFIEAIMRYYDSSHILLVTSHWSSFYSDGKNIRFGGISNNYHSFLKEIDEYFALKTNCVVINVTEEFFPINNVLHDIKYDEKLKIALEEEIISVCETDPEFRNHKLNNIRKSKYSLLSKIKFTELHKHCRNNNCTIADYIAELKNAKPDFLLILKYFRHIDYSFDDIVALFWLHGKVQDKNPFKKIALEILKDEDGVAYLYTKKLFGKNKKLLSEYKYCMIEKVSEIPFGGQIVISFSERLYLKITSSGDLKKINFSPCKSWDWDYKKFIENGSVCDIEEIEDVLSSCALYFERARKNDFSPLKLRFNSINDFIDTLYYIDYAEILSNENYCIVLPESNEPKNYLPIRCILTQRLCLTPYRCQIPLKKRRKH